jgi:hypothetical protein
MRGDGGIGLPLCALFLLCGSTSLSAAPGFTLILKKDFSSGKKNLCLSDIVSGEKIPGREMEKLVRYCRIEFKGARLTLSAKDIELHAWAAGIIPDRISGGPVTITRTTSLNLPAQQAESPVRVKRGSSVQLVVKSEHMQIAREAALLQDAFAGETVEVRPAGTRKTLRAKLVSNSVAELLQ